MGADAGYIQPLASWRVTLDGTDITDRFNPRLVSLRLSEKRGESADQLEIVVTDHDGNLALPPEGATLSVELGWERGTGVATGLVAKGSFRVDEVTWEGPPDQVTITARSADLKDSFRTRKTRLWKDKTLGAIIGQLAADNSLTPRCHGDLAGKRVTLAEQHNKSDMQFVRDLGRRYDAVATVKDGCLIFAPVGAATTSSGKALPALTVTRQSGDRYSYKRAARENAQDGAEANWHDQGAAKRKTATHGGSKRRRLKRVYASEGDASAAASAETNRLQRAAASMEITLALGDATLAPGVRITAQGFKSEVDGRQWQASGVEHSMDGSGGFQTRLEMEVAV